MRLPLILSRSIDFLPIDWLYSKYQFINLHRYSHIDNLYTIFNFLYYNIVIVITFKWITYPYKNQKSKTKFLFVFYMVSKIPLKLKRI